MNNPFALRIKTLSFILLKEQLREPTAFLWTLLSPSAIYYFMILSRQSESDFSQPYLTSTSWFYAYISSSVALFGFSFYIIGRRESGFVRSFIYDTKPSIIFLTAHFTCYSLIALLYCSIFYVITKPSYGGYSLLELSSIASNFYICYIIFCTPGLLLALAPLKFQTANTLISIFLFFMLVLAFFGKNPQHAYARLNLINPLALTQEIMHAAVLENLSIAAISGVTFLVTAGVFIKKFRVHPVWSRY
jgi:ABC-2 type transport system permease protein